MPKCCDITTVNFINVTTTTIPWTLTANPIIQVFYLDEVDDTFYAAGMFTRIERTPTSIFIDHGGLATGVVKIIN